jgi:hypothetical protein
MPIPAKDLERDPWLRVLLMGGPKTGKTSMAVATSPPPVRVFLCEHDSALRYASHVSDFDFERTRDLNQMLKALAEAKADIERKKLSTIIIDPLSTFATTLEEQCLKATDTGRGPDGRRAYPEFNRRLRHLLDSLFRLPCHLIVITHYIDVGGGEVRPEGGGDPTPQTGEGIVPLLPGKARALVSAMFPDVVWMDYRRGERVLVTGPTGAWGPGCRSLPETRILPADIHSGEKDVGIRALIKAISEYPAPRAQQVAPRQVAPRGPSVPRQPPTPSRQPASRQPASRQLNSRPQSRT